MNVKWVLLLRTLACAALLTAPPGSRAAAAFSETELTPGDFFGFRHFGTAVAIDGDTAVVGVPQDPEAGFDAGAAYVYLRTGSTWSQQAKLMAADAAGSSEFGSSVAISGDTLVVGAPFTAAGGAKVGAAYAFVRSGTTWMQQSKLVPTDAIGDDLFGASVAIDGETLAVGAIGTGQDYFDEGAVYVYARSGGTWTQQARLRSSQPGPGNAFGFSLALNNSVLAVGSPYDDDLFIIDAGAVYVFTGNGATWNLQDELTANDATSDDHLGWSVALNGDTLVAGAPQNPSRTPPVSAGTAYVFVRNGVVWGQQAKLVADDAAVSDAFGYSVAAGNNQAVIGSVFDSTFATQGGSAYRFKRTGNLWSQDSEFSAGDIANFNHFGYAIAASGVTVVVGAPLGYFFEEGATYVFESPNTAPVADSQAVTATEDTPLAVALAGSDAEGDSLNFIVLSNPTKGTLSGAPPGLIYTPAANMNGSDSFTFKANDGSLDSEPATVSITITPVNDGPSISDIPGQTVTQNSSTDPLAFTVSDVDNDPAALIVTGSSDNPALVPDGNIRFGGSGANRTVTVAPAANQTGTATIQVTVSDGLATAGRTFTLTVTRANLPPVADASASPTTVIAPNNMNASVTLQGSRSADPDGDSLTYRWYSNGDLSTPIGSGMSSTVILGTGTYNITLVVNDGVATDSDTVLVTVLGASQAIDRLIDEVGKVDAPPGQKKDLISGLQRAQQDVQRGDYGSAANELVAAQNKIADWSGKRIAPATAQSLIQEIQHIIDALPLPPNATPPPKGRRK